MDAEPLDLVGQGAGSPSIVTWEISMGIFRDKGRTGHWYVSAWDRAETFRRMDRAEVQRAAWEKDRERVESL